MSVCPCKNENRLNLKIKPAGIVLISLQGFCFGFLNFGWGGWWKKGQVDRIMEYEEPLS